MSRQNKSVKIPAWAKKVQAAYRTKFKLGDIVRNEKKGLGVITSISDAHGDVEVSINDLTHDQVSYAIWFKSGQSAWHEEEGLTLVQAA